MTSPQQWRPAPPQQQHNGQPYGYGPPVQYGYQQPAPYHQAPQHYAPQQQHAQAPPNINVTVSPTMNQSVTIGGRRRHGLLFHIVMTVCTGGLWLFIAPILAMRRR